MYSKKRKLDVNTVVIFISFIIFISPAWEVITDLNMVGKLFAFGSHPCLKYRLDLDSFRQCTVTESNTEFCLYLRGRSDASHAQPDYISILCLPFLLNYFVCYYLWVKNKKLWTYCGVRDDEEEEKDEFPILDENIPKSYDLPKLFNTADIEVFVPRSRSRKYFLR